MACLFDWGEDEALAQGSPSVSGPRRLIASSPEASREGAAFLWARHSAGVGAGFLGGSGKQWKCQPQRWARGKPPPREAAHPLLWLDMCADLNENTLMRLENMRSQGLSRPPAAFTLLAKASCSRKWKPSVQRRKKHTHTHTDRAAMEDGNEESCWLLG